jgi:hypothetical protein
MRRAMSTAYTRLVRPVNLPSLASAAVDGLSAQLANVLTTPSTARFLNGVCGGHARLRVVVGIACARAKSPQTGLLAVSHALRSQT